MNKVSNEMKKAGDEIAHHLMCASVEKTLGVTNVGGCKSFDIKNYPEKYHDLIISYLNEEIISVEAIYIAMDRERNNNKRNEPYLCPHCKKSNLILMDGSGTFEPDSEPYISGKEEVIEDLDYIDKNLNAYYCVKCHYIEVWED